MPSMINLMAATAVSALQGAVAANSWGYGGHVLVLVWIAAMAMVALVMLMHREVALPTVKDSVLAYTRGHVGMRFGWRHGALTALLIAVGLSTALWAATVDQAAVSVAEGIRNGVFLAVGLKVWRLNAAWRLSCIAVWVGCDVLVYASMAVMNPQAWWVAMVVGACAGWVLMNAMDYLDYVVSGAALRTA